MREARLRFLVLALSAALAGALLLVAGEAVAWQWLRALLAALGGLTIASVALGAMWEFVGRAAFLDAVLDRVGLAKNLERAGIRNVTNHYLREVPWRDLITSSKHVDLLFAYAQTWRNSHRTELGELLGDSDARVRTLLPDPDDLDTMRDLSRRYELAPEELAGKVREAIEFFRGLASDDGAELTIYVHPSPQVYAYYRFDDRAVVSLYRHAPGRGAVPVLDFESGGSLFQLIKDDFEGAVAESRVVYPES